MKKIFAACSLVCLFFSCGQKGDKTTGADSLAAETGMPADTLIIQTAKEAYTFGLPLILMDLTRRQMTNVERPADMGSPVNQFCHKSEFPDASFKDVVRPNADTYYSTAFLDLNAEPMVLSVPNTQGRYYLLPMLDAYTNVIASPGKRTTGTTAQNFLITGPKWSGIGPAGMEEYKSPTNMVWIIGRTQVNSKADGEKVAVLQHQYKLTPLRAWGKSYLAPAGRIDADLPKGSPNEIVQNMPIDVFFNYMDNLMVDNPPTAADGEAMKKFATIGVSPGGKFDLTSYNPADRAALKLIPAAVLGGIQKALTTPKQLGNGWSPIHRNTGAYGTDYALRAVISYAGLGANLAEDAIYPSCMFDADGKPLNGANKYAIHFDKGKWPPAGAFWSLTMYDPKGSFIANPLNRYAIGDRSNLKVNADGSLDLLLQHVSPGMEMERNWLPAPEGAFNLLLRVYAPMEEMLNGSWKMPPVKKTG